MNIALVLSGGTGTRLGGDIPKQYMDIKGQMLISFCLKVFSEHKAVNGIWIVADINWQDKILEEANRLGIRNAILGFSAPGENRQLSIYSGLTGIKWCIDKHTGEKDEFEEEVSVIIHDAARPNITSDFLDRCLDALCGYDGVMPVLPMKDTVYFSESGERVDSLLDRSKIYAGQAPEIYLLDKYIEANEGLLPNDILKINGSTEPAIKAGLNVAIIPGDENNYKITTKKDMERFISGLE